MSLCDSCFAPGACCKGFVLRDSDGDPATFWVADGIKAPSDWLASGDHPLPFVPMRASEVFTDPDTGHDYQSWLYECTKVTRDGRCSIYDTRPQLCRSFEPASGGLCVHYRGAESGDPTVSLAA